MRRSQRDIVAAFISNKIDHASIPGTDYYVSSSEVAPGRLRVVFEGREYLVAVVERDAGRVPSPRVRTTETVVVDSSGREVRVFGVADEKSEGQERVDRNRQDRESGSQGTGKDKG